ncbi:putative ATPase [Flavobacterium sp. HSC-32F16]|uniref:AAA family ATPase n=1 Tax=Flavobacterium sp. HSC-32F16 TaxID=2910964 RepID=UPI0020A614FC|nr:AAA family ATPase [Flavobacterium sp. HSC-32F16]MCP2029741.1 putative ATPase [Flavobacterium sp. HSC-32F16]
METKKNNFYVITGGPGVGKTTLINKLFNGGFLTIREDARRIIKEQMENQKDGLPWKNKDLYANLMLEASINSYNEIALKNTSNITFFDRGILDAICYMKMENIPISKDILSEIENHPYNKNVFILPPWKEIYETDGERKQDWKEAELTFCKMKNTYIEFNYKIIEIPKISVEERVKFILKSIANNLQ